jgi:hypothetical protein
MRGHGIGDHEEFGFFPSLCVQLLDQFAVLTIQHCLQPGAAHILWCLSVQGIADGHIVTGNRFGNCRRCLADVKEPARHFLSGSDLRKRAEPGCVQIDL